MLGGLSLSDGCWCFKDSKLHSGFDFGRVRYFLINMSDNSYIFNFIVEKSCMFKRKVIYLQR